MKFSNQNCGQGTLKRTTAYHAFLRCKSHGEFPFASRTTKRTARHRVGVHYSRMSPRPLRCYSYSSTRLKSVLADTWNLLREEHLHREESQFPGETKLSRQTANMKTGTQHQNDNLRAQSEAITIQFPFVSTPFVEL